MVLLTILLSTWMFVIVFPLSHAEACHRYQITVLDIIMYLLTDMVVSHDTAC
jgi:hypothetical protein